VVTPEKPVTGFSPVDSLKLMAALRNSIVEVEAFRTKTKERIKQLLWQR
jgi:hypothetical protein